MINPTGTPAPTRTEHGDAAGETEQKVQHTPTPWKAEGVYFGTDEEDSQTVGYVDSHRNGRGRPVLEACANAEFIVRAVNIVGAHEEKLAELMRLNPGVAEVDLIGRLLADEINNLLAAKGQQ